MNSDTTVNIKINATDESKGAVEEARGGFASLWKQVAGGQIAAQVAMEGINLLKQGFSAIKDEMIEGQQVQAQLNQAVKNAGGLWGVSADQANKLADAIGKKTPIDKENTLAAINQLETFTKISGNVYPQATQAVADLATAMNNGAVPSMEQMSQISIMLGKALDDPIKNIAALHKRGVDFTEQQKDQIKTLVETGDQLGAQKIILDEVAREYGGRSAAALDTWNGKLTQVKNNLKDYGADALEKTIKKSGELANHFLKFIETSKGVHQAVEVLRTVFHGIAQVVDMLMPSIRAFANAYMRQLTDSFSEVASTVRRLWNELNPALLDVLKVLAVVIGATLYSAVWLLINVFRIVVETVGFLIHIFGDLVGWTINVVRWFGELINWVVQLNMKIYETFWAIASTVKNSLSGIGSWLYDAGRNLIDGLINGVKSMIGQVGNTIKNVASGAVNTMKSVFGIHSPSTVFAEIGNNLGQGLIKGVEGIKAQANVAVTGLVTGSQLVSSNGSSLPSNNTSNNTAYNSYAGNTQTVSIGQIVLGSDSAVQEFFRKINQDNINTSKGLTPVQGNY
jgi:phage-related protein